jgi:hypothetical protein
VQQRNWEIAMGRPPIGTVAMTSTERSRRRRAALATKPAEPATKPSAATKPATKPSPAPDPAKDREIAELKARIAGLEQERDRYKQMAESGGEQQLKDRIAKLEKDLRRAGRGFIWSQKEYNDVAFCVHPDRISHLKDDALTARFNAAFDVVRTSKDILVDKNAEIRHARNEKFGAQMREEMARSFRERAQEEAERRAKAKATREKRSAAARAAADRRKAAGKA